MHRTCFSFFHYDYKWEKFGVCASSIHLKLNRIRTKKRCLNQWPFGMVWATARKKGRELLNAPFKRIEKGTTKVCVFTYDTRCVRHKQPRRNHPTTFYLLQHNTYDAKSTRFYRKWVCLPVFYGALSADGEQRCISVGKAELTFCSFLASSWIYTVWICRKGR